MPHGFIQEPGLKPALACFGNIVATDVAKRHGAPLLELNVPSLEQIVAILVMVEVAAFRIAKHPATTETIPVRGFAAFTTNDMFQLGAIPVALVTHDHTVFFFAFEALKQQRRRVKRLQ